MRVAARRRFLIAAGALALAARTGRAQHASGARRVGALDGSSAAGRGQNWETFHRRMRELGHEQGPGYHVEHRWANGDASRLPALAAALVALKPDVIVTGGTPAALAAKRATSAIPVVFCGVTDPLGSGLVGNLARPDGNLTGVVNFGEGVIGKWIELMRSVAPGARSLAFLTDTANLSAMVVFEKLREEARGVGVDVRVLDGSRPDAVTEAFRVIEAERLDGVIVSAAGRMLAHRKSIAEAIARLRLPAVHATPQYPEVGGLLSYSADHLTLWARAAEVAHRILGGAKPAEIPVEQASKFVLVVNLRAAKSMGITIPPSILLRADRIIE